MRAPFSLALSLAAMGAPAWAAQINFAQYPAGTAYKAPIPNVILSVDTSGSMDFCDINGVQIDDRNDRVKKCNTAAADLRRITYLKQGIKTTLIDSTKYDEQFRLAWQSFACDGIPSSSGNCSANNKIAKFSGTHKQNFKNWVEDLSATGATPSHKLVYNAGEYLKTTGNDSPWNATPGTADSNPLACRRAYHIFLTDGGWNFTYSGISGAFKDAMRVPNSSSSLPVQNIDSKDADFPDDVRYSTGSAQTRIYRDDHPNQTRAVSVNWYTSNYYAYPTLAELAFDYWSTDLQPTIKNDLKAKIRKAGPEKFESGSKSVTLDEYWNPKNDPASWQHLVQYTIGYGSSAGNLIDNSKKGTSPQFTGGVFGMYDSGFSSLAAGASTWDNVISTKADTEYDDYRPQEMWHMAINSRGKFYPVAGGDLSAVFADIFDDIIVDTTAPVSGTVSASRSVSRVGTTSYQTNYIAADDANSLDNRWYGYVTSNAISTTGTSTPNPDWGTVNGRAKSSADKLDERTDINQRLVVSYDANSSERNKAVSFKWANLSQATATAASPRMWLEKGTVTSATTRKGDGKGEDRLNFIRGDRTKEQRSNNTGATFRNRKSRQGDIVNSAIWYTGAPSNGHITTGYQSFAASYRTRLPMLYVGGNDGMLHGFSAADGQEKIAYIPHGVLQNLAKLSDRSDPVYNHQYYVDGSPITGDVDIGGDTPAWRTYLAGTLGVGGRGYFVLDVTNSGPAPQTSTVSNGFTENNVANLVVMDKTAAAVGDALPPSKPADPNADADIGHILGTPVVSESNQQRTLQITRTNNKRWALILGNGYNSLNERPVLLIQYLDGDKALKRIEAAAVNSAEAVGNGLSTPQFLDVNSDGVPDYVYAGDLRGNLWKFDISHASDSRWGVAFSGSPLFTATYQGTAGNSSPQPITTAPVLRPNREVGGLVVAFGTGQSLREEDRIERGVQSVYSILDNTRYVIAATGVDQGKVTIAASPVAAAVGGRSSLVVQGVNDSSKTAGTDPVATRNFWKLSSQDVTYACAAGARNCSAKKGWYMDLPVAGERVTTNIEFYDGSNLLEIISEVPASGSATAAGEEICAPTPQAAQPFRTLIHISSGKAPSVPVMYLGTGRGYVAQFARMTASSKELRVSTKGEQLRMGNDGKKDPLARLPEVLIRPNWRQLK